MPNDQSPDGAGTTAGGKLNAWAVGYEDVDWDQAPEATMSRRELRRTRAPYRATVPPFIADLPVDLDADVASAAAEATAEVARFDGEMTHRLSAIGDGEVSPLSAVLLRTESASSSQIEQITAGARALALASLGERAGPN